MVGPGGGEAGALVPALPAQLLVKGRPEEGLLTFQGRRRWGRVTWKSGSRD